MQNPVVILNCGEGLFPLQGMSNQIRALEKELGFPVFIRLNRGVELTAEGRILFEYWEDAYNRLRTGIDKAKDEFAGGSRNVFIGIQDIGTASEDVMAGFIEFEKLHEDLRIDFEIISPRQMLDLFDKGQLDMAVLYDSEFSNIKNLNRLALHDIPFKIRLYYSRKHPLAGKKNLSIADFLNQSIGVLSPDISLDFRKSQMDLFESNGMHFTGKVKEYATRRHLELGLLSGKCFTVVYESMFSENRHELLSLELDDSNPPLRSSFISLFWKDPGMEIKARALSNILREKLNRYN